MDLCRRACDQLSMVELTSRCCSRDQGCGRSFIWPTAVWIVCSGSVVGRRGGGIAWLLLWLILHCPHVVEVNGSESISPADPLKWLCGSSSLAVPVGTLGHGSDPQVVHSCSSCFDGLPCALRQRVPGGPLVKTVAAAAQELMIPIISGACLLGENTGTVGVLVGEVATRISICSKLREVEVRIAAMRVNMQT